jgi:hypothetical protein
MKRDLPSIKVLRPGLRITALRALRYLAVPVALLGGVAVWSSRFDVHLAQAIMWGGIAAGSFVSAYLRDDGARTRWWHVAVGVVGVVMIVLLLLECMSRPPRFELWPLVRADDESEMAFDARRQVHGRFERFAEEANAFGPTRQAALHVLYWAQETILEVREGDRVEAITGLRDDVRRYMDRVLMPAQYRVYLEHLDGALELLAHGPAVRIQTRWGCR